MKKQDENHNGVNPQDSGGKNTPDSESSQKDPLSGSESSADPSKYNDPSSDDVPKSPPKKPTVFDKLMSAMKRNKPATAFAIALLVVFIWLFSVIQFHKVRHQREITSLITQHEQLIDSLTLRNMELSARIFSWSVRSELMRQNTENLNQLFTRYVQETEATLVQLISVDDGTVVISTDKQFEGRPFGVANLSGMLAGRTVQDETGITVYTMVMSFNEPLGILVVRKKVD